MAKIIYERTDGTQIPFEIPQELFENLDDVTWKMVLNMMLEEIKKIERKV